MSIHDEFLAVGPCSRLPPVDDLRALSSGAHSAAARIVAGNVITQRHHRADATVTTAN